MITILSPAKTFNTLVAEELKTYKPLSFHKESLELIERLKGYSKEELAKLMKMSMQLAEINEVRNHTFEDINLKEAYEAILYFYGEAYKGLDAKTLSQEELEYIHKNIRILSGLYGVIAPLEVIKPYRLEMGTKLINEKGKDLYSYWRQQLTNYFLKLLSETSGEQVLIQLASDEYSKALDLKMIEKQYRVIQISFKEYKEGKYKIVGMYTKKARGLMIRYMAQNAISKAEDLKQFNEEGYVFRSDLSDGSHFVYTRG